MKIKGSVNALTLKKLFAGLGIAGVLLIALRIYQVSSLIDPASGFFTDKSNFTVLLFYIFSICFVLSALVLFFLSSQAASSELKFRRSIPQAAASALMSFALAYEAVSFFKENGGLAETTKLQKAYFFATCAAAVIFLLDIAVFVSGAEFGKKIRALRLIPVLWAFFLTVGYFDVTASYLHSTQLLLTIFGNAFLMVFLFEYARKLADINAEENTAVFCSTGLIAAILLLSASVPALILKFTASAEIVYCPFKLYNLLAAVFCITSLFLLKGKGCAEDEKTVETELFGEQNDS